MYTVGMKIIVPMAGRGSRFQKTADTNPEYKKPKPFISVKGIPMVRWATGSLPFLEHPGTRVTSTLRATPADLIFVILKEHDDAYGIEHGLREIYSDAIRVIILPNLTRGAAETAYHAKPYVAPEEDVIISDSDHYFDGAPFARTIEANRGSDVAGIIPVFTPPADGIPRWSYSRTEKGGTRIVEEGEKDRSLMEAGAYANIGAYYFSQARLFFDTFENAERENKMSGDEGKKEFYIAPLYRELLDQGKHLEAAILPEVWGLGTPTDLEYFLANCPRVAP
jgi:NDP-sugar pyrophosphorylase family protein